MAWSGPPGHSCYPARNETFCINDNARARFWIRICTIRSMPLPILPTVFRCSITHDNTAGGQSATNVIHVASAVLTPSQVITALDGAATAGMFDAVSVNINRHRVVVTKLDGVSPSAEGTLASPAWNGTGAGDISPGSAPVITFRTSQRGRRHTGRLFVGLATEDKIENGQLVGTVQATMAAAWTTFIANCGTAGIPLQVTSYGHDGEPPPPPKTRPAFAASTVGVETAEVGTVLGTQRRRQSRLR